jgi:hypothetical protein
MLDTSHSVHSIYHNLPITSTATSLSLTTAAAAAVATATAALNNANNDEEKTSVITGIMGFSNAYRPIHGWLATFVCFFGISSNLLNIIVLTRPNLVTSPTNLILTGLAISDLLTMLSSFFNTFYYYIVHADKASVEASLERDTLFWTHFTNVHVMTSVTFHSISIWLTVYLACFRYIYIASSPASLRSLSSSNTAASTTARAKQLQQHQAAKRSSSTANNAATAAAQFNKKNSVVYFFRRFLIRCRTYKFTLFGVLSVCVFCVVFCFPAYICMSVQAIAHNVTVVVSHGETTDILGGGGGGSANASVVVRYSYAVKSSEIDQWSNGLVFKILFYTQAIFGKFLPCILLVTFSSLLVHSLVIINRNNKKLSRLNTSYSRNVNATAAHNLNSKSHNDGSSGVAAVVAAAAAASNLASNNARNEDAGSSSRQNGQKVTFYVFDIFKGLGVYIGPKFF